MSSFSSSSNSSSSSSSTSYRQFSLDEIREATNNFDIETRFSRSEEGWTEYLAEIYDVNCKTGKTRVVTRRFGQNDSDNTVEFNQVSRMITRIQHPNLASPLGYCKESGEQIHIYKYMEKGSLSKYLYRNVLSWKQRLEICLGAAYGLQHLHRKMGGSLNFIIHKDVRSDNILLDENWVAKVSEFGLPPREGCVGITTMHNIDNGRNDPAYLAPELLRSGHSTRRADVYAFGAILIQVLCGKKSWDDDDDDDDERGFLEKITMDLGVWAQENLDNEIKADVVYASLKAYIDAIEGCLQSNPKRRATMDGVVVLLETALNCQEHTSEAEPILNIDLEAHRISMLMGGGSSSSSDSSFSFSSSLCRELSLAEIKEATNNFDEKKVLGHGGEGKVYLAEINLGKPKKTRVAVKLLDKDSTEFDKEIKTVAKIKHPHIVSLLGLCKESGEKILIYEYMENGSLSDYVNMDSRICLSWKQRLNICLGAAYGLQHLHKETQEFGKGIIHRDVKPANILLDHNWLAKVSDFGMFKLSDAAQIKSTIITDLVKGTRGYFAPEYLFSFEMTRKIDVYAFGVVMFEVLCRKKPWDIEQNENLALLAQDNVDVQIKKEISHDSLVAFTDIIGRSLKREPDNRPTMDEVVGNLKAALMLQVNEDNSRI